MAPNQDFTPTKPPDIPTDKTLSLQVKKNSTENNEKESIVDSAATDSENQVNTPEKKPLSKTRKRRKKIYVPVEKDANGDSYGELSRFPHAGFGGGKTKRSKRKAKKTKKAKRKGRKSKKSRKAKKH